MRKLILVASLLLVGCADPYASAKQTITIFRGGINVADAAFLTAWDTAQGNCLKQFPVTDPRYTECIKKPKANLDNWVIGKRVAESSASTAEAIVVSAEQKHQKLPVDWFTPVKLGICTVAEVLQFLPESVRKYVDQILALVRSFTCK
ncbi:MAG: hypothetical protein WC505_05655 [Patescibacteria group bacterium]